MKIGGTVALQDKYSAFGYNQEATHAWLQGSRVGSRSVLLCPRQHARFGEHLREKLLQEYSLSGVEQTHHLGCQQLHGQNTETRPGLCLCERGADPRVHPARHTQPGTQVRPYPGLDELWDPKRLFGTAVPLSK